MLLVFGHHVHIADTLFAILMKRCTGENIMIHYEIIIWYFICKKCGYFNDFTCIYNCL